MDAPKQQFENDEGELEEGGVTEFILVTSILAWLLDRGIFQVVVDERVVASETRARGAGGEGIVRGQ